MKTILALLAVGLVASPLACAQSPPRVPPGLTPSYSPASTAGGLSDADILYFAYNLEVFEAQFYSCIANGVPISSSLLGGGPSMPSGCVKGNLTSNTANYAAELAREETAHVKLLYNSLKAAGANPVAPAVDISAAFEKAAEAAFGVSTTLSPVFDPSANDYFFLHSSFLFEDLGVSAYLGALNSISNSTYRLVAAQIAGTEAYHAALGRTLLYQVIDVVPAYNSTVRTITDAIVAVLNKVAGSPQVKYQIYNNEGAGIANVDSNGLSPAATPQQVLKTVTLGAPSGMGGGFFPNNLNGNVKN